MTTRPCIATAVMPLKAKDPTHPSERMRQAIESPRGRQLYIKRIGTVGPVCQPAAQQALEPLESPAAGQNQHAMESVLHGTQHREAGEDGAGARLTRRHQSRKGTKLRQTVGMNIQILILNLHDAQGMAHACWNQVFLQAR